jgi:hypothetical protein
MSRIGTYNSASGTQVFNEAYANARAAHSAALADERERRKRRSARKQRVMPEGLSAAAQRTWRLKEQLRREDAKTFVEDARFEAALVRERLERGFRLITPKKVYGRWREDVHEKGLRSEAFGLPGRMFVASCHKGGELRMSWDKARDAGEGSFPHWRPVDGAYRHALRKGGVGVSRERVPDSSARCCPLRAAGGDAG